MKVLVCGGRDFKDKKLIYKSLDKIHRELGFDVVIEGDSSGVDRLAGAWARNRKLDDMKFRADWEQHGKAAGPIRNRQMLQYGKPDLVIAFPGGKGTENMIKQATAANIPVRQISLESN